MGSNVSKLDKNMSTFSNTIPYTCTHRNIHTHSHIIPATYMHIFKMHTDRNTPINKINIITQKYTYVQIRTCTYMHAQNTYMHTYPSNYLSNISSLTIPL